MVDKLNKCLYITLMTLLELEGRHCNTGQNIYINDVTG